MRIDAKWEQDGEARIGALVGLDDAGRYMLESDAGSTTLEAEDALVARLQVRPAAGATWVSFDDPDVDAYVRGARASH